MNPTALFDPVPHPPSDDYPEELPTPGSPPPYPADFASLYRSACGLISRPPAPGKVDPRASFREKVLKVIAASPAEDDYPTCPGTVLRFLATVALADHGLDPEPLYRLFAAFPAGAGNSLDDALGYERDWIVSGAPSFAALRRESLRVEADGVFDPLTAALAVAQELYNRKAVAALQAWNLSSEKLRSIKPADANATRGATRYTFDGITLKTTPASGDRVNLFVELPVPDQFSPVDIHVGSARASVVAPSEDGAKLNVLSPRIKKAIQDLADALYIPEGGDASHGNSLPVPGEKPYEATVSSAEFSLLAELRAERIRAQLLLLGLPPAVASEVHPAEPDDLHGASGFNYEGVRFQVMPHGDGGARDLYIELFFPGRILPAYVHVGILAGSTGKLFRYPDGHRLARLSPVIEKALSGVETVVPVHEAHKPPKLSVVRADFAEAERRIAREISDARKPPLHGTGNPLAELGVSDEDFREMEDAINGKKPLRKLEAVVGHTAARTLNAAVVPEVSPLAPTPVNHYARVRELRMALTMGPREFLGAVTRYPVEFTDNTESATVLVEWEARKGELTELELLAIASGLRFPLDAFVEYLEGGSPSELLARRL